LLEVESEEWTEYALLRKSKKKLGWKWERRKLVSLLLEFIRKGERETIRRTIAIPPVMR